MTFVTIITLRAGATYTEGAMRTSSMYKMAWVSMFYVACIRAHNCHVARTCPLLVGLVR